MNREVAAAVLGVPVDATADQVRAAFRLRARLYHPDRLSDMGPAERSAANAAMQQLTAARAVMNHGAPSDATPSSPSGADDAGAPAPADVAGATASTDSTASTGTPHSASRSASPQSTGSRLVCNICRRGPARAVEFNTVTGMVLAWRWSKVQLTVCRTCGDALYNDVQARNFTRGWWGIIAPLAMIFAAIRNASRHSKLRRLRRPFFAAPDRVSARDVPAFATAWGRRIGPYVSGLVFLGIVVALIVPSLSASTHTYECWADSPGDSSRVTNVACDDPAAQYRNTVPAVNGACAAGEPFSIVVGGVETCIRGISG